MKNNQKLTAHVCLVTAVILVFAVCGGLSLRRWNSIHASSASSVASLGREAAAAAALAHAGVSADEVRQLECEPDLERGAAVYDIEFRVGAMEYDYEVDAATGVILKAQRERND